MSDPVTRLNTALGGRYRIERELGEGGMATVYLADDLRHERKVALKVLKPELAAVVGAERFLTEIKTTARLQHPHILPLFDSGEADGFLFYVMPYVEGESLRERIDREKQLPIDDAVRIATAVASALDAAHERGVIHRDIKPANILLSRGDPLVADFGIALAVSAAGGARLTETGLSIGTPYYMSPEQATGDHTVGAATDVYALGCVLYEMLVGEPPHSGTTAQAVLAKILTELPRRPTAARPAVRENVEATVLKALEKLPADRFGSAQELAAALADPGFRHGEVSAPGSPATANAWKGLASALGLVAVVSTAVAIGAVLRDEASPLVSRFEVTYPAGLQPYTRGGQGFDLSPDGSRIAFLALSSDGTTELWLRAVGTLEPVAITGTTGAGNPRFSPDGASIAYQDGERIAIVPVGGGRPQIAVSDSAHPSYSGVAWGPDRSIYFRKTGQGIWRVPAPGSEPEQVTTPAEGAGGHQWPEVLPNGKGILYTRDLGPPSADSIMLHSLESGEDRALFQGAMARYSASGHIVYAVADGTLLAAPFDEDRLQVTGASRTLQERAVYVSGTSSGSYFAVSRTGTLLYRPSAVLTGLTPAWLGRDGSEEELAPTVVVGRFEAPAVSPDGSKVALEYWPEGGNSRQVWIYDLEQETFSPVTFEGANWRPFWSPDGGEVGFLSDRRGPLAAYARPADLSGEVRLVWADPDEYPILEALWTHDSRGLVYRRSTSGEPGVSLYFAPLQGDSVAMPIVDAGFTVYAPSLSPDGRFLAYTSRESGPEEVYVRPFPGPGGRIPVSVEGGSRPVWAHDAPEIVYLAPDGYWMVATVTTDPDFAILSRDRFASAEGYVSITTTQHYDLSPDAQRLLALRAVGGPGAQVRDVVVLGFFDELRRLVPD